MKQLVICLILSTILLGYAKSQSVHDEACNEIQKAGVATCFDRSTLGFCTQVENEWRAIEAATCDTRLCCNAKLLGCTMSDECTDELTTAPPTVSTSTSTEKTDVACVIGQLKKHESDCKRYYYCSRNVWVESVCSAGVYDENRMSCAFGSCNNS